MSQGMKIKPIRILLIEDNPGDVALFREMLDEPTAVQFELTHCDLLNNALTSLSKESFDII